MVYSALINNITLIVALSILYSLIVREWEYASKPHRVISGFLFGAVAVIGMMNPLVFSPGLIFDGRSIIISIAGFIGGWVTALIAALMSITYRVYLGGPGAIMGVSVITSSAIIGIAYHNVRKQRANLTKPIHLVGFGIIVHVCMLILTMTLPSSIKLDVFAKIAAPVITIYPIGTLLVCLVLLEQESRILAEKALRNSKEKYRELVENANSIILRMDKEGRVTFFNEFAEQFFGFRKEDIVGQSVVGTIVPERETTGRDLAAMINDIGRNPEAYANNENENMRSNGERIWIAWTNRPVSDMNGNVTEILCVGNEITGHKKAEDALKQSEERLRRITDNMVDLVLQMDTQAVLQYLTPSVERVLGYHIEDVLGKSAFDFIHPDDRESAISAFLEVMKTGYGMVEVRIQHHDGHYVWMELLANALAENNGERSGIVVGCRDTTERKRAEEALMQSEERLRKILEVANIGIWERDLSTGVFWRSLYHDQIFGYTEPLPEWTYETFIGHVLPEDRPKVEENNRRSMTDPTQVNFECRIRKVNGEQRWIWVQSNLVINDRNEVVKLTGIVQDITERKQAERSIAENEARLRTLVQTIPDLIWLKDVDGIYLACNTRFESFFGAKETVIVGKTDYDFVDRELADFFREHDRKAMAAGKPSANEEWITFADDGYRGLFDTIKTPMYDAGGKLIGVLGIARDITVRKQAEESLKESQQQLADIINFLPDAALVIDKEGRVIAWNRAIEDMTGVRAEEMLGKGNYEYAIPFYGTRRPILIDLVLQPKEELQEKYRTIKWQGNVLIGEAYIPNLRENLVYLLGTASPLYDTKGAIVGAIETIRDITNRRQMEVALASEHDRLAAILDGIPIPAFMIDRNQIVVLWNRNNEIFTGKTKEEVLGKRLDLSFLFKDKTPPTLAELVLEVTDEDLMRKYGSRGVHESDVFPGAFESVGVIFSRGEERIMSIQAARIYNPQGEIIGAIQTAQDITDRVRIQEEREKLQSQLIQAQKMEAIGTLAGGIAHDFNNILSGIMGYTELYKEEVQDRPKVYQGMEQVLKAAERAKDLVRQILTFSRKTEQEKKPTALSPIIREVVKFMRASLPTTIEITQKIEETSDVIMADPTQLHQVLINLCTNAGHAMKETGGVLEIGLEEVVINVDDLLHRPPIRQGHYLVLTVRDTGQGISQENLERIFEPYFTTKEKGEGTGLGLAVVHGIVKDHAGEIRVYSEVGKGTIFRVYLPLMEKHVVDGKDMEETILPGQGEKILFIDDEKMVANLNKELLEVLGYRVVTETDPVNAIEIFRGNRDNFDIVITDKTMPHMTGFDVAREIRNIRADIPVVLCSGFQEKGDMEKLKTLGINQLIKKPIRMSALAKAIRDVLDKEQI